MALPSSLNQSRIKKGKQPSLRTHVHAHPLPPTDLAEIPLSTLLTANRKLTHKAARKAAKSSQTSASTSTTTSKARTLAEMKHRLAQMQRAKGKAVGVDLPELPPPSSDDDEEDEEREGGGLRAVRRERKEDKMKEDDREKAWQERKEKMKRDNKHA